MRSVLASVAVAAALSGCRGCVSDRDGDGVSSAFDCDDRDPDVYPGAIERCDGVDQDCDGEIDEDAQDAVAWLVDADGDGYGVDGDPIVACSAPGRVQPGGDCDDTDAAVNPGAVEVCDGRDTDCDGVGDGPCPEVCDDGVDNDLDGRVDCEDADCVADPACLEQVCDNDLDDDDDGATDCDDPDCWGVDGCTVTLARVLDGTAARHRSRTVWADPDGVDSSFVARLYDLAGSVTRIDADGSERCTWVVDHATFEGITQTEDGLVTLARDRWLGVTGTLCALPAGALFPTLLDPTEASWSWDAGGRWVHGHRFETWDEVATIEVSGRTGVRTVYHGYLDPIAPSDPLGGCVDGDPIVQWADGDHDGAGDPQRSTVACAVMPGFVEVAGDCDDADPAVRPGATEVCGNGIDDDCDGDGQTCPGLSGLRDMSAAWANTEGEAGSDVSGRVAAAGDVDGDGLADWLVGGSDAATGQAGAAYLLLGGRGGTLDLRAAPARIYGLAPADHLAGALAGIGDVDGDGFDDLALGATGVDWDGGSGTVSRAGAVYVLHGPLSGDVDLQTVPTIRATELLFLGAGVAAAGDTDGDDLDDLWVGATADRTGGTIAGAAYLFRGPLNADAGIGDADAAVLGPGDDAKIGEVLAGGDLDGDGVPDLVVGDRWADGLGTDAGEVHVLFGPHSGTRSLADADVRWDGARDAGRAGGTVALGDLDGDGATDVATGAKLVRGMRPSVDVPAGRVHLVAGGAAVAGGSLEDGFAALIAERIWDEAGTCLAVGDLDGDGWDDLVVGARGDDTGGLYAGAVYVVHGPVSGTLDLAGADGKIAGEAASALAGFGCAVVGDVDGDGVGDLAVGERAADDGERGRASVLLGGTGW